MNHSVFNIKKNGAEWSLLPTWLSYGSPLTVYSSQVLWTTFMIYFLCDKDIWFLYFMEERKFHKGLEQNEGDRLLILG